MKIIYLLSAVVFFFLILSGCDQNQYQIVTGSDGSLYRFNKKTGELSMIMEDKKVVRLSESAKTEVVSEKEDHSLERPSDWKDSRYPGKDLKVKVETVWRENKLCYKISLYPYKSLERIFAKKQQDYVYSLMKPGFNVEFVDKNGFMIREVKINLWSMTKVNGEDGKISELVVNSQLDCSKRSYRSIGGYNIKWALEPDLIADEKEEYIKSNTIQ